MRLEGVRQKQFEAAITGAVMVRVDTQNNMARMAANLTVAISNRHVMDGTGLYPHARGNA